MERRKARRIGRPGGTIAETKEHESNQAVPGNRAPTARSWMARQRSENGIPDPSRIQTQSNLKPALSVDSVAGDPMAVQTSRRRRGDRRYAEMLVERAGWIPSGDRALVEAVHGEGLSVVAYVRRCLERGVIPVEGTTFDGAAVGRRGQRDLDAWSRIARRRLRRLNSRLASDRFAFVIARRNTWPTTRRRVAVACVLHGDSLRQASRGLGLSLHTVRRHVEAIDAMYEAFRDAGAQARDAVEAVLAEAEGACR